MHLAGCALAFLYGSKTRVTGLVVTQPARMLTALLPPLALGLSFCFYQSQTTTPPSHGSNCYFFFNLSPVQQGSHALQLTMPARSRTLSGRSSQHAYAGSRTGSRVRTISGRTTSGAEAFSLTAAALRRTAAASTVRDRESRLRALREPHLSRVHFRSSAYSCLEEAGVVRVTVVRSGGDLAQPLQVHYETQDGGLE